VGLSVGDLVTTLQALVICYQLRRNLAVVGYKFEVMAGEVLDRMRPFPSLMGFRRTGMRYQDPKAAD
jgi:hypothetical protein